MKPREVGMPGLQKRRVAGSHKTRGRLQKDSPNLEPVPGVIKYLKTVDTIGNYSK